MVGHTVSDGAVAECMSDLPPQIVEHEVGWLSTLIRRSVGKLVVTAMELLTGK